MPPTDTTPVTNYFSKEMVDWAKNALENGLGQGAKIAWDASIAFLTKYWSYLIFIYLAIIFVLLFLWIYKKIFKIKKD